MRRVVTALTALAILTGCGSVEDAIDEAVDEAGAEVDSGDDSDDSDPAMEPAELPGSLVVTGAIEDSLDTADENVVFRPGGFCQQGGFGISAKTDRDDATVFDLVVDEAEQTSGSQTVQVDLYDIQIDGLSVEQERYRGDAQVELDIDSSANTVGYTIDGDLTSQDDPSKTVTVDFEWTVQIACS